MQQIRPIFQKHVARLHEISDDGRAEILQELKAMNEEVSVVLDNDQERLWQRYLQGLPGQFRHGYGPPPLSPGRGPGSEGRLGLRRGRPGGPGGSADDPTAPHESPMR
jgi:hypothetical protein